MAILQGFPPAGPVRASRLILGSFPSILSLQSGQYYGNPRNHFWPLLASALGPREGQGAGEPCPGDYPGRLELLERSGLAVWDVIASCEREGSLDSAIREERPNAILDLLAQRAGITAIGLNGGRAAAVFRALFCPELPAFAIGVGMEWRPRALGGRRLLVERLPSTSPIPTRDYRCSQDKAPLWEAFLGLGRRG